MAMVTSVEELVRELENGANVVDLSNVCITERGANSIPNALTNNNTITSLSLSENDISSLGALSIAELMMGNQSLKSLDLSKNPVTEIGAIPIADALRKNILIVMLVRNRTGYPGIASLNASRLRQAKRSKSVESTNAYQEAGVFFTTKNPPPIESRYMDFLKSYSLLREERLLISSENGRIEVIASVFRWFSSELDLGEMRLLSISSSNVQIVKNEKVIESHFMPSKEIDMRKPTHSEVSKFVAQCKEHFSLFPDIFKALENHDGKDISISSMKEHLAGWQAEYESWKEIKDPEQWSLPSEEALKKLKRNFPAGDLHMDIQTVSNLERLETFREEIEDCCTAFDDEMKWLKDIKTATSDILGHSKEIAQMLQRYTLSCLPKQLEQMQQRKYSLETDEVLTLPKKLERGIKRNREGN